MTKSEILHEAHVRADKFISNKKNQKYVLCWIEKIEKTGKSHEAAVMEITSFVVDNMLADMVIEAEREAGNMKKRGPNARRAMATRGERKTGNDEHKMAD